MKKMLPFKTIKKKITLVDTRPDLYLILRFLCVPLEEAHVPLVVRVPHFENHCNRAPLGCGEMGDLHHGCAADKSAATA